MRNSVRVMCSSDAHGSVSSSMRHEGAQKGHLCDLAGRAIAVVVPVHAGHLAPAIHVAREALQQGQCKPELRVCSMENVPAPNTYAAPGHGNVMHGGISGRRLSWE